MSHLKFMIIAMTDFDTVNYPFWLVYLFFCLFVRVLRRFQHYLSYHNGV